MLGPPLFPVCYSFSGASPIGANVPGFGFGGAAAARLVATAAAASADDGATTTAAASGGGEGEVPLTAQVGAACCVGATRALAACGNAHGTMMGGARVDCSSGWCSSSGLLETSRTAATHVVCVCLTLQVDGELAQCIRHLAKRDPTTKTKALQVCH